MSHGEFQSIVVSIDGFGIVRAASRAKGLGGGEERFDRFVAQNDERSHRPETTGERFVAARMADAANDVLAAKLFQIVCGAARTVLCTAVVAEAGHANPCADPFRPVIGARRRPPCGAATVRFAADSLLEESGFELSVPPETR